MEGHNPTLEAPEWSLILAACSPAPRTGPLLARSHSPIDWTRLFTVAEHQGVVPLLCRALLQEEPAVPGHQMQRFRQYWHANLRRALILSSELIRIVTGLESRGLPVLPYKGLALAEMVYGDVAARQTGDIDLLICPRDFVGVRDALAELGYAPHPAFTRSQLRAWLKSGYECAFDGSAGKNLVEVQWAVQPRFYAVDFDMEAVFRRAVPTEVAGRPMMSPSAEDLFILLSLHAAKHVWGKLIWLSDIARVMQRPTLDWCWIGAQARSLGVARVLRVTMGLAARLLGTRPPEEANRCLPDDDGCETMVQRVLQTMQPDSEFVVESVPYFRLMIDLRERKLDRVRFISRLLLTPGPGEWACVPLPEFLFPLYPVVRLSRLAARLLRV